MIALNIAIQFDNKTSSYLTEINNLIEDNNVNFDKQHIPHLTLLQFYCKEENAFFIQNLLKKINLDSFDIQFDFELKNNVDQETI